jgi:hypothetical protein
MIYKLFDIQNLHHIINFLTFLLKFNYIFISFFDFILILRIFNLLIFIIINVNQFVYFLDMFSLQ